MSYDDSHRTLLQTIMHAGIMSDYEFQQTVATIFNYKNSATMYVGMINKELEPLDMAVRCASCEFTGDKYWMFVNAVVDNVNRFQTQFSQSQLELLRKVFEEIITSADGRVSNLACLNITTENVMNKADRDDFLNEATRRMWLSSKDGYYYMGVRSIMELMPYFRATYQDGFNNCPLCKQIVFHGQRCEGCEQVAHLYCLATFARIQKPLKCRDCGQSIPTENLPEPREQTSDHEEESLRESDEDISQQKRKKTAKQKRTGR